jgi:15-cis-phytoene synthase
MILSPSFSIFRRGSRTYFYSSLFFPSQARQDIFCLYAFVRVVDDAIDQPQSDIKAYKDLKKAYQMGMKGQFITHPVVADFIRLKQKHGLEDDWIEAFFAAMEMDIQTKRYETMADVIDYMYGSAEIIGLCMAKILNLPTESYTYARKLGRAMQYINFIRDIHEDEVLNRLYFPREELDRYGLQSLALEHIKSKQNQFFQFIANQIETYRQWQTEAEKGYSFIPKKYLVPIKTAADMYAWTASRILNDPIIIYHEKIKPGRILLAQTLLKNTLTLR